MKALLKKEIGLSIFILLLSAGLFASVTVPGLTASHPAIVAVLLILLLLWTSTLAIILALVSKLYVNICLLTITGLFVLFARGHIEAIISALLFLVLAVAARHFILRNLRSRIEFRTRDVFYAGLKYIMMGVIILLAGLAVPYLTRSISTNNAVIPESIIRLMLKPYQPYLQSTFPGITVDESLEDIVAAQLNDQPGLAGLSAAERARYTQQLSSQLSQQLNQNISGADNIATIITDVINNKIRIYSRTNPIVTIILIFSLLIIVSRFLISWLAIIPLLLTALLIYLSRRTKLVKLIHLSQPVEKLVL